jgi:hypothetical protein
MIYFPGSGRQFKITRKGSGLRTEEDALINDVKASLLRSC